MGCGAWCVASCWYAIILASGASYSTQYDGSGWFRPGIVRILGEVEICKHADGHADGSPYRGVAMGSGRFDSGYCELHPVQPQLQRQG